MTYDPSDMPRTAGEFEALVDYYFNKGVAEHAARVTQVTTQAKADHASLPDTGDKPTLEEFVALAMSQVEPLRTRDEWERHFRAVGYYPEEQPLVVEPPLTPEQIIAQKRTAIDAETSAAILAGFDYAVNGQSYHFNYDSFDQQNFADTANACLLQKSGAEGLPATVVWNGYLANGTLVLLSLDADAFLALYMAALAHKKACMDAGSQKKAALIAG